MEPCPHAQRETPRSPQGLRGPSWVLGAQALALQPGAHGQKVEQEASLSTFLLTAPQTAC